MFRVTRRYEFSASHRLHSAAFGDAENQRLYGKCNNPYGHGHNYAVEVSALGALDPETGRALDPAALDALVDREVLAAFAWRNLNADVEAFSHVVPTSENLAREICHRLKQGWHAAFPGTWPQLARVRVSETERNCFEIDANEIA